MSTTIDQRVVEMRFDNKQFEQNVSNTMSSLDKLKQKLKLDGATKGLEEINTAANRVDMSTLGNSVEKVGLKFSLLYSVADQYLRRITDSVYNYSSKIVKALTIDPVKMGFQEYETQIGAIQTILSNTKAKGTTLEDVNGALDELNTYADKTIYNFTEMTRNIGTFTAAGVDLDTSVSAIKGIANLAAVSGSTSQQASTAMYQLSQALASGTVKLMDWNSVVNAGMGGQVFQDALKETARVHGIAIDDIIKQEGSFRESLSTGWLSSKILTETLSKFTGDLNEEQLKAMGYTQEQIKSIIELGKDANDAATKVKTFSQLLDTLKEAAQSGWTQTWEIIVGDFEEAKALFSTVSDTIGGMLGKSAAARNDLLENWKVLGGRQAILDAIKYSFEGIVGIVKAIKEAAAEIFPPKTAEKMVEVSEKIRDVAKAFDAFFHIRDENGAITGTTQNFENLKRTLKGIFAVVDIVRQIFVALFKALGIVFGATDEVGGGILAITAVIGDWLVVIRDAITYTGIFQNVFTGIANIVKLAIKWFGNLGRAIGESFLFKAVSESLNYLVNLIVMAGDETNNLANLASNINKAWQASGIYKFLSGLWGIIKAIGSGVSKVLGGFFGGIIDAFSAGDFETIFELINGLLTGGFLVGLIGFVNKLKEVFSLPGSLMETFEGIAESVNRLVDNVGDTFAAFQNKLKADALLSIAKAIAVLAAAILIITFIEEDKLERAMATILILMTAMTVMMKVLSASETMNSVSKQGIKFGNGASGLVSMALALVAAGLALKMLAGISWPDLLKAIAGVTVVLGVLLGAQILLSKFGQEGKQNKQGAKAMQTMAVSLLILSVPLKVLGGMEWDEWGRAIMGVTIVLAALAGAQLLYGRLGAGAGKTLAGAVAINIMATSLMMLTPILLLIGLMPTELLIKAGVSLLALLTMLGGVQVLYGRLGGGAGNMLAGAAAIAIIATSLNGLIPVLITLAVLPLPALAKSVTALTVILAALGGVQVLYGQLGGGAGNMISGAVAIAIMSASLTKIIPLLGVIAIMKWTKVLQGVLALTAVLGALGGVIVMMNQLGGGPKNILASAAAIAAITGAVLLLVPALMLLGSMKLSNAVVAVGVLLGTLLGLVAIATMIQPIIPAFMALAKAITAIGVGMLAAGAGILLFGAGLIAISVGIMQLIAACTALVGVLGVVVVGIVSLVAAVIEGIVRGIGQGIVALCEVLIEALPLLADTLIALIVALCDVIIECAPKIVDTILILILKVLEGLVKYIPPIVSAVVKLITGIIQALAGELPGLVQAVVDLLFAFIESVIKAIGGMDASGLADALKNVGVITLILAALAAMKALAPAAMVGVLAMAAVMVELAIVLSALSLLSGLSGLIEKGGNLMESVGRAIGKFVGGLVGGFAQGATKDLPEIAENLSGFAKNIGPFVDIAPRLATAFQAIGKASIVDSIATFFNGGLFGKKQSSMDKFAHELPAFGKGLADFSDEIGARDFSNIEQAAVAAEALTKVADTVPNEGGWLGKLVGENSIAKFGKELKDFATGLVDFSTTIGENDFSNVANAVTAAESLTRLADSVPNEGGLVAWFTGENSIAKFGKQLGDLGTGIATFAEKVNGVPDCSAAVSIAQSLVDLTSKLPNEGGVVSWFAGDQSIAKYGKELGKLADGIVAFSEKTSGIDAASVKSAVDVATGIVNLTEKIPNQGGMVAWFAGDQNMAKYGRQLGDLASGLSTFASKTADLDVTSVESAVKAAGFIVDLTTKVPNYDGVAGWFAGEFNMSKYGRQLGDLGRGLATFASSTSGMDPVAVESAAKAASHIVDMTKNIPKQDGIVAWFAGEQNIAKYGKQLGKLGSGLADFADKTKNVNGENMKNVAEAGKHITEMTSHIPNQGGMVAWFTGDQSLSKFGGELGKLGTGINKFATNVGDADMSRVEPAANAVVSLAKAMDSIPSTGGLKKIFSGEVDIEAFAEKFPLFASGISGFARNIGNTDMSRVEPAALAAKHLGQMAKDVPKDTSHLSSFGTNIVTFGSKLAQFFTSTGTVNDASVGRIQSLVSILNNINESTANAIRDTSDALTGLSDSIADLSVTMVNDMSTVGGDAMQAYIDGLKNKQKDAENAAVTVAKSSASKMSETNISFQIAGSNLIQGFINGMEAKRAAAYQTAASIATACLNAIQAAMDSHSPSRETEKLGRFGGMGFINGWLEYADKSESVGHKVGEASINGLRDAISRVQDYIDSDMDTQPTITPVLDLTSVEAKASQLSRLFSGTSVGVNANIGAINSMMNDRAQNGSNDDVVSALNDLRGELANKSGDTYQINGITYDDGSNISEAVRTLIRAAKIDRRV